MPREHAADSATAHRYLVQKSTGNLGAAMGLPRYRVRSRATMATTPAFRQGTVPARSQTQCGVWHGCENGNLIADYAESPPRPESSRWQHGPIVCFLAASGEVEMPATPGIARARTGNSAYKGLGYGHPQRNSRCTGAFVCFFACKLPYSTYLQPWPWERAVCSPWARNSCWCLKLWLLGRLRGWC